MVSHPVPGLLGAPELLPALCWRQGAGGGVGETSPGLGHAGGSVYPSPTSSALLLPLLCPPEEPWGLWPLPAPSSPGRTPSGHQGEAELFSALLAAGDATGRSSLGSVMLPLPDLLISSPFFWLSAHLALPRPRENIPQLSPHFPCGDMQPLRTSLPY